MNAKGALTAAVALVVLYLVYKIYQGGKTLAADAGAAIDNTASAVAGALVPDANAAVQSQAQEVKAALAAANPPYPAVGSPAYNKIVGQFNPALEVQNSLSGGSSNGG